MRRTPVSHSSKGLSKNKTDLSIDKSIPRIPPSSSDGSSHVFLVTEENSYELPHDILGGLSTYWEYVFRHRNRWSDSLLAQGNLGTRAMGKLVALGVFKEILTEISRLGIVEVRVPFTEEIHGWAARVLPWEFLLRLATGRRDLVVIRHLDVSPGLIGRDQIQPKKLLFVQSAPGDLAPMYNFETEKWLVQRSLDLDNETFTNPTIQELERKIGSSKPDVIHLAGIDLHEGDSLLKYKGENKEWDGYYVSGSTVEDQRINAMHLGGVLNADGAYGSFVACNFYYSAARVASLAVANGSSAAIGFQGQVDDALAESFFASFYQRWRAHGWDTLQAFREAWSRVAVSQGAGIVLWSRSSLIRRSGVRTIKARTPKILELGADKSHFIKIDIQPNTRINYSLLHNGEGLFR